MNNRFTGKGRVILLLLLVFQLGLKFQASARTRMVCDTDTTSKVAIPALKTAPQAPRNADTIVIINGVPTKMSVNSPTLRKDTTSNGLSQDEIKDIPSVFNTTPTNATIVAPPTDGTIQVRNFGMQTKNTTIVAQPTDGIIQVKDAHGGYIQGSPHGNNVPSSAPGADANGKAGAGKPAATTADTLTKKVTDTLTNRVTDTITNRTTDTIAKSAAAIVVTKHVTDTITTTKRDTVTKTLRDTVTKTVRDTITKTIRDTITRTLTDTLSKKADSTMMKKSDTTAMQQDTLDASEIQARNIYLGVGGAGLAISVSYDTRFGQQRDGWGYTVGVGGFVSGGNKVVTVPFQLNFLIGNHTSFIEAGGGATFLHSTGDTKGKTWQFDNITGFVATGCIGYRYQPETKGISFKVSFTPILYDEGLIPAGGISVGYTFK